jgi:hypothetical protein
MWFTDSPTERRKTGRRMTERRKTGRRMTVHRMTERRMTEHRMTEHRKTIGRKIANTEWPSAQLDPTSKKDMNFYTVKNIEKLLALGFNVKKSSIMMWI